jgi:hypothetical protein
MVSDIHDSDLCDNFIGLSHKKQDFTVHDTYKRMSYMFICFKYVQKVEKHRRIEKKIQIQVLKSSMNRENLLEYHKRSNCADVQNSKIHCQHLVQCQF